jgi:S-adenosylmethionine-diacylglycerol 3-amino-3-carboxypropyl transferase
MSKSAASAGNALARRADFSEIRYAQCWEDADVLLAGLDVQPGDTCLSIASAGDNTLALLGQRPGRVIALDLSEAQLACLELRVAAYRALSHSELLVLIGSRPGNCRQELYRRCRNQLSPAARSFWDARHSVIEAGIGAAGKFERYFALFRRHILPLVHSRARVSQLLRGGSALARQEFYCHCWDTWRWRAMFNIFFSRAVLGHRGRDPRFFDYVEGSVARRLRARVRLGLTEVNPAENPYVQWILTGQHQSALPYALRAEHFATIRENLDRLEWQRASLEDFLAGAGRQSIDRFNLSDIFEYMSEAQYTSTLEQIAAAGRPGGRLAYWNMLVARSRPATLARQLAPLGELARQLHALDKACFYTAFILEEIVS